MAFKRKDTWLIIIGCFDPSCFIKRLLREAHDETCVRRLGDFPNPVTFRIVQSHASTACVVQEVVLRFAKTGLLVFRVMDT